MNFVLGRRLAAILTLLGMLALPLTSFADAAADLYKSKCAMCHGADGKGKMAGTKDLASPEVQKSSDAELNAIITKGKAPKMPAYDGKLTPDQIKSLVTYIRSLK